LSDIILSFEFENCRYEMSSNIFLYGLVSRDLYFLFFN